MTPTVICAASSVYRTCSWRSAPDVLSDDCPDRNFALIHERYSRLAERDFKKGCFVSNGSGWSLPSGCLGPRVGKKRRSYSAAASAPHGRLCNEVFDFDFAAVTALPSCGRRVALHVPLSLT